MRSTKGSFATQMEHLFSSSPNTPADYRDCIKRVASSVNLEGLFVVLRHDDPHFYLGGYPKGVNGAHVRLSMRSRVTGEYLVEFLRYGRNRHGRLVEIALITYSPPEDYVDEVAAALDSLRAYTAEDLQFVAHGSRLI